MSWNYSFLKCLNPRKVVNPYTKDVLLVGCGHCSACRLKRSSRYAFQCSLESKSAAVTVFVTLTYSNEHVRRVFLRENQLPYLFDVVDCQTGEFYEPVFRGDFGTAGVRSFLSKCNMPDNSVPVLCKRDVQLFIKRLRKQLYEKRDKCKIRYFAVGEYGPKTFRPHYHLLLYFDRTECAKDCDEIVSSCWKFGRVDVQITKGDASQYVAGYVNSYSTLPKFLAAGPFRPFLLHSWRLGCKFLEGERKRVYELSARDFVHRSLFFNGRYKEFDLWRSCSSFFYPRCKAYAFKSAHGRLYSYTLWNKSRLYYPVDVQGGAIAVARRIASEIFFFGSKELTTEFERPKSEEEKAQKEFLRYFVHSCNWNEDISSMNDKAFSAFVYSVYSELLLSRHFLTFVCDHNTVFEIRRKIKLIDEFWSSLDSMRLKDFYESQSLYFEQDFSRDEDVGLFYDNSACTLDDIKASYAFGMWSAEVSRLYNDRIKHKVLNDANKIFCD